MGCLISCDPPQPPTGSIVATAFIYGSDMSSLQYCSDSSEDAGAASTPYFVFLTDTFFSAYSSLCGAQVEITYKNTIHAQVVDAITCSECRDEDIAVNYAALNALNGCNLGRKEQLSGITWRILSDPVEQSQPAPLSCLPSQPSTTLFPTQSASNATFHPQATTQRIYSATLTDVAGRTAFPTASGNTPWPSSTVPSPVLLSAKHSKNIAKVVAPSVILSLIFLCILSFMGFRRLLRRRVRQNRCIATTPAISHPQREQSPQLYPYFVHLTPDPDGEVPTARREKTAQWEKSLRGGAVEPVLDLMPDPRPARPERPSSERLDLDIGALPQRSLPSRARSMQAQTVTRSALSSSSLV